MTTDQLERLAMSGADLPDGLSQSEQLLFFSLRSIYRDYRAKHIDRDAAKLEKAKILKAYELNRSRERLFTQTARMRNRLADRLSKVAGQGCPECKRIVSIFDGFLKEESD